MDKRVIDYIQTNLSKGYPIEEIKKGLIQSGISEQEIDSAMDSLQNKGESKNFLNSLKTIDKKTWIKIILGIALVLIICIIAFIWLTNLNKEERDFTKDIDYSVYCGESTENPQDTCLKIVALYNQDENVCNNILGEDEREECLTVLNTGNFMFKNYKVLKNEELSSFFNNRSFNLQCQEECNKTGKIFRKENFLFLPVSSYSFLQVNGTSEENKFIFSCYCYDSQIEYNISMCEKYDNDISNTIDSMGGMSKKSLCYLTVAREKKDVSICEYLGKSNADSCYFSIASSTKDISICEKINDSKNKQLCKETLSGKNYSEPNNTS
jgi:hypothetical protein